MLSHHKDAFFKAAQECACWIGLREPNPLADRWIGKPGTVPKPESCKAKTSDNPHHKFAGLVVDPTAEPGAFTKESLSAAIETWKTKFLVAGKLPAGFTSSASGPEKGLVRFRGSAIFSDFDLMAIIRSNAQGERLATTQEQQKELYAKVAPMLQQELHVPMIQHPTEFMWAHGVGARESEWVLWFGPGRRLERWPSSMPKGGH
ncbi:MAG: hypothetical protein HY716_04685 [Planctomycetes bacterium]|nr:hypothetical protein [Planctomycetota bacterium]